MDEVLIFVFIPVCLLCFLLFITLFLYVVPLRFFVSFVSQEQRKEKMLTVSWSVMGIRITSAAGQQNYAILVADHELISRTLFSTKTTPTPAVSGPEAVHSPEDLVPLIQHLVVPVMKIGTVLYRQRSFEDIRGTVRIGLGDPVATGLLYGGYWATRFVFTASRIHIDLKPDFDREILEMELSVRFRINHPLRMIFAGIRVARMPDVMKIISGILQKNRVAQ